MLVVLGQILLWLGLIGAALTTVFRLEDPAAPWQTITWSTYAWWLSVGWIGVLLLRAHRMVRRRSSGNTAEDLATTIEQLRLCSVELDGELTKRLEQLTCEEVLEIIDDRLSPRLTEFADQRMVIAHQLGTPAYAAIMTEFASGERYLNRAWSAAADGYVDEVEASVNHASRFLHAASNLAQAALAAHQPRATLR